MGNVTVLKKRVFSEVTISLAKGSLTGDVLFVLWAARICFELEDGFQVVLLVDFEPPLAGLCLTIGASVLLRAATGRLCLTIGRHWPTIKRPHEMP